MKSRPNNVLNLGYVSLLNDLGSELLVRLVPLYLQGVLGAPMSVVGAIEGVAEGLSTLLKPIFGMLSDRSAKRKRFVLLGYFLSALTRPFLALASHWALVAGLRFCDRLGKGVRTAPRDALIADSSQDNRHGKSFGINRSLDTVGALIGVTAFGVWTWSAGQNEMTAANWSWLCLLCGIPGFLAVALTAWGVEEVAPIVQVQAPPGIAPKATPAGLPPALKRYLVVVAVFCLANSSDAFILLRAKQLGYSLPGILALIGLFNVVSALTALPAAALSDRLGRRSLIAVGWAIYAGTYALLGSNLARNPWVFGAIVAIYGLFYGFTDGVERAWVADMVPSAQRGRAYGIFGLIVGTAALPASALFGWAWDHFGPELPFFVSSLTALLALILLYLVVPTKAAESRPTS